MKVEVFCGSEGCGWSFSVDVDQPVPEEWSCPKCDTQHRRMTEAEIDTNSLEGMNPELGKRLGEDGWCLWPPQDGTD
jgi:hypothetical protein